MATVDNKDTVLYGCIRVALELQPSEENATLMKRVRQIGICLISTLNLRFLETLYIHALPLLVDHDVAIAESFSHFSNAVLQLQWVFVQ